MDVRIEGASQLASTARAAGAALMLLTDPTRATARIVAGAARSDAPTLTGRLRSSITASTSGPVATIGDNVPYAGVIHFGWPGRHISANPFVTNAAQRTEPIWRAAYEREIDQQLNTVKGK